MKHEKDLRLVNIYLKIHNKQPLTMDDMRYLAWYAPECFEKTCKNVMYNMPETKPVVVPDEPPPKPPSLDPEVADPKRIQAILDNIKSMETDEIPFKALDADKVKNLLGNLYMEMLFPHNGESAFISATEPTPSLFDKKV